MELSKNYQPKETEAPIYQMWLDAGCFRAEVDAKKEPFSIVIPPPNVTGQLHLGHAFDNTLQDAIIRVKRMQGYSALWVPGTDHAGIATQIKVEENLRKEGKTRFDYGREKFVELVWDWKNKYGSRIIEQLKTLGSSCDWSRERFTMDEGCSEAVREVFVKLYEKGLIYKGTRIINWCPQCTTALSDTEVEHAEHEGNLWHIRYPVKGQKNVYLTVATTRPETMLGDTAVAVHPEDERYTAYIGQTVILPLCNREIPIVADEYVDREFGTGCVKITPCHDPNDFEVASRHNLPHILVLDEHAVVNENGGHYQGLSREDARKAVLRDLEAKGLLVKTETHMHNVGHCYRCTSTVEPISSAQWFVKMAPLAEPAIEVVRDGRMQFKPERFTTTYLNWMENVRDWCISRQLWWGHRIPAFYCADCGHVTVSRTDPDTCEKCGSGKLTQDEDVLDTWFSSALWPFSTLGWPEKTPELDYFYPTSVVCPGYEIIFFWVARMIFSGMEHMGDVPFRTAFIHGIVRDEQGRKMSKSLGNGIDPVEVIDRYGADALRLSLITGVGPGNDLRFRKERIEAASNFCNKLWNASRFVLMNLKTDSWTLPESLELPDMWILSRLNALIPEVTANIDEYDLGLAASKVHDFIWDEFCDWYIELTKPRLNGDDPERRQTTEQVLYFVLQGALKLLHPFMPFITEQIWQALPKEKASMLMLGEWPKFDRRLAFPDETRQMQMVMDAIKGLRSARAELNVPPSKKANILVETSYPDLFRDSAELIMKLANGQSFEILDGDAGSRTSGEKELVTVVTTGAKLYMPLEELVDVKAERARREKELTAAKSELETLSAKLNNPGFVNKAPEKVVSAERERLEKLKALIQNLEDSLS